VDCWIAGLLRPGLSVSLLGWLTLSGQCASHGHRTRAVLQPHNRSHASTTNAVGQSVGYFIAFSGFLALKAYSVSATTAALHRQSRRRWASGGRN
jgi:hypothetical protein